MIRISHFAPVSIFFALLALSGCEDLETSQKNAVNKLSESGKEIFSYEISAPDSPLAPGCTTGRKSFSTKTAYCNSLRRDGAVRGCGRIIKTKFEPDCSEIGYWTPLKSASSPSLTTRDEKDASPVVKLRF